MENSKQHKTNTFIAVRSLKGLFHAPKKNEQKLRTYMFKISGAGLFVLELF